MDRSMTRPSSQTQCPAGLCPPPRTAISSPYFCANSNATTTSLGHAHRAITPGRRSISALKHRRADSYCSSPRSTTGPVNERRSSSMFIAATHHFHVMSTSSKGQLRPNPFGEAPDCVVCFWCAAGHHLEAVQHLRNHIERDFDAGLRGSFGKHSAVIDEGLVASSLQVDRREASKIRVEWAGRW